MEIESSNFPESISMSWHHFLSSFLLCGLLGIAGSSATSLAKQTPGIAQTSQAQVNETQNAIADRLYGFWQSVDLTQNDSFCFKFDTDDNFTLVELGGFVDLMKSQIETSTQPMQIDREMACKGGLEEPDKLLGAMSRSQQAYRLESPDFADTIDELQIDISSETETYRYEIIPQRDPTTSVMMTATAKQPDLLSYTSFVYVEKDEGWTTSFICETNEPSTVPPDVLVNFNDTVEPVRCGEGSHPLDRN